MYRIGYKLVQVAIEGCCHGELDNCDDEESAGELGGLARGGMILSSGGRESEIDSPDPNGIFCPIQAPNAHRDLLHVSGIPSNWPKSPMPHLALAGAHKCPSEPEY